MKLDIEPKFEKAWYYANEHFTKITLERLESLISNKPSWKAAWSEEELEFLVECWHVINTGKCKPENYVEEVEEVEYADTVENLEFYEQLKEEKEED